MNLLEFEYIYKFFYSVSSCCEAVQIYYNGKYLLRNEPQRNCSNRSYRRSYDTDGDKNSSKVNQQTSQANVCTGAAPADGEDDGQGREERLSAEEAASAPTICQNNGTNTADISR